MDLVKDMQKLRLNNLRKKEILYGWLLNDNHISNKIYRNLETNKYVVISCVTNDHINPYPPHSNVKYQGIVHSYVGDMPQKPNSLISLLTNVHDITWGHHDY